MNQYTGNSRQNQNRRSGKNGGRGGYDPGHSDIMSLLLFYILPFILVNLIIFILVTATPSGMVTIGESSDFVSTSMELKVKSLLPIKAPVLTLNGNPVEFQKTSSGTYTATLTSNGVLEADLICINKMKNVIYEQVSILDDAPPSVDQAITEDGVLSFRLDDSQSGVDYSSIYAFNDTENSIPPLSIDRGTGLVTFDISTDTLTVCAKDIIGNELRMTFDPSGQSGSKDPLSETVQTESAKAGNTETESAETN